MDTLIFTCWWYISGLVGLLILTFIMYKIGDISPVDVNLAKKEMTIGHILLILLLGFVSPITWFAILTLLLAIVCVKIKKVLDIKIIDIFKGKVKETK